MTGLIHGSVEKMAAHAPTHEAATFLSGSLTYGELDAQANQLAHTLIEHGVQRGDRVGLHMDKSLYTPVALYGIMKAGAAYVPLDPSAPVSRIAQLIEDAGIRVLISHRGKRRTLKKLVADDTQLDAIIGVDDDALGAIAIPTTLVAQAPRHSPNVDIAADDLAYIIYTSGSTGTPKGMMHTHASCLAFSRWAADEYGLTQDDRLSNHAPLHFDLSILDYFAGSLVGATVVIIPEEHTKLPASYAQLIEEQRISVLYTVPFALIQLLLHGAIERFDFAALRWVIFGGEAFAPAHLRALMDRWPHARFDNIYGPAEVNGITHYVVPADHDASTAVPIGPLAHQATGRVVDSNGDDVAQGDTGELWVESPTAMRGYWRRPDLDDAVFVRANDTAGTVRDFFRTGDLVIEDAAHNLHFVGRKDRQVKVRGYRVELDEIELALGAHEAVVEAATFALPDADGTVLIHAQATLHEDADCDETQLTRHLKQHLPWYAVPAVLSIASTFPRTTSGKIDRRALGQTAQSVLHSKGQPCAS